MNIQPIEFFQLSEDYKRIEKAIYFLEDNYQRQPELKEIADAAGLSEFHFQRVFIRWVGISPKRFLQFITKENAKKILSNSSVLDVTYSVGLSSPGRLHDLFIHTEAVSPGEYKTSGAGITIRYAFHPSPFGELILGVTDRGICHLSFVTENREKSLQDIQQKWENAVLIEDHGSTEQIIQSIFSFEKPDQPLNLFLRGTNFQIKVWEALLRINRGSLTTYEQIAESIGSPKAMRAVGTAIGQNPISFLIPCHRVIQKSGNFGNYRWGPARKKAIIGWENNKFQPELAPSEEY